ncbi:MAG TPA: hypothetical protein VIX12_09550 [Candidatus Binataceae bacterium]
MASVAGTASHRGSKRVSDGGGGIQWIPWSELSSGQRIGRIAAAVFAGLIVILVIRTLLHTFLPQGIPAVSGRAAQTTLGPPLSDGDRKDGIVSMCKVFQIYGLPKTDADADTDARNAAELFKLAGDQSPQRSAEILIAIAREFSAGKLKAVDCETAGEPLPASTNTSDINSP